jgi:hypothetical protein
MRSLITGTGRFINPPHPASPGHLTVAQAVSCQQSSTPRPASWELHVVDFSNPAAPLLRGSVSMCRATDAVAANYACRQSTGRIANHRCLESGCAFGQLNSIGGRGLERDGRGFPPSEVWGLRILDISNRWSGERQPGELPDAVSHHDSGRDPYLANFGDYASVVDVSIPPLRSPRLARRQLRLPRLCKRVHAL